MKAKPILLRRHHLSRRNAFDDIYKYGALMVRTGYSEHETDQFSTETYNFLKRLKTNPNQRVLVIAGEPDFICKKCPKKMKEQCSTYYPNANPLFATAFWDESMNPENIDKEPANKAGLEIRISYSVKEIIEATTKQTEKFKSSLENC